MKTRIIEKDGLYIPQVKSIFGKWKDVRKSDEFGFRYSSWNKYRVENFLKDGDTFDMSYRKQWKNKSLK